MLFAKFKNTKLHLLYMSLNPPELEQSLQVAFAELRMYADTHAEDTESIITELNAIINKTDPDIVENKKPPLPLIDQEFKPMIKNVKDRIFEIIGTKKKIPELRFDADRLSVQLQIPLPNTTRKNNEALLQWFHVHWTRLEPYLLEMRRQAQNPIVTSQAMPSQIITPIPIPTVQFNEKPNLQVPTSATMEKSVLQPPAI